MTLLRRIGRAVMAGLIAISATHTPLAAAYADAYAPKGPTP
ncbi:hypothetical protein [Rhodococcoides fascians]|nr:hypothetical protein [Rhodococcus fascians]